jgi:hypothetical protein
MKAKINLIAWQLWRKDVAEVLLFQWLLLFFIVSIGSLLNWGFALSALISGLAILLPSTVLGMWLGLRLFLGKNGPYGIFIGGFIKTLSSAVLLGTALVLLKEFGLVWQGFFMGLISMVLAPILFRVGSYFRSA